MNSPPTQGDVTQLLCRWQDDRTEVGGELLELVHPVLERLARRSIHGERSGHTLQTQALVNEAYLRLVDQDRVRWAGRAHFYAIAAQSMRRILVDHARRKNSQKRGGEQVRVEWTEARLPGVETDVDLLALDEALKLLAERDSMKSRVVELHFFGGFSQPEIAKILDVSLSTVERNWRMARAWLFQRLKAESSA